MIGSENMVTEDLIIIGNGFDLSVGLKSSYKDYYDYVSFELLDITLNEFYNDFVKELRNIPNDLPESIKCNFNIKTKDWRRNTHRYNQSEDPYVNRFEVKFHLSDEDRSKFEHLSFWDLLFIMQKQQNSNWYQIEDSIKNFLIGNNTSNNDPFSYNIFNKGSINNLYAKDDFKDETYVVYFLKYFFQEVYPENRWKEPQSNIDFLLSELKILENNFCSYLKEAVNKTQNYNGKSFKLLRSILGVKDDNLKNLTIRLLSFNYTTPNLNHNKYFGELISSNIHGTLNTNDIIFGIDQTGIQPTDISYPFTKTYRQLTDINLSNKQKNILPKPQSINNIYFYGHSLSSLDYSYFQSIFDYYDIYSSNVRLFFCYKTFDNKTNLQLQKEIANLAINLLTSYSNSIENLEHRKNMIHKLLIEDRLKIKEIKNKTF